ncbi:MAG: glycogen debranching N-terminal domain-containing protein [Bacillota bacterium]
MNTGGLSLRIAPERVEEQPEVIKKDELFMVTLRDGSIPSGYPGGLGLYFRDTRFLSCFEFLVENQKPILLSSGVRYSHFYQGDLTNPEVLTGSGQLLPIQTVHFRFLRLIEGAIYQRFRVTNYSLSPVAMTLTFKLGADFRDIFEIRGTQRERRGDYLPCRFDSRSAVFRYRGLDDLTRTTCISWQPFPESIVEKGDELLITYSLVISAKGKEYIYWKIAVSIEDSPITIVCEKPKEHKEQFIQAALRQKKEYACWYQSCTRLATDRPRFNQMLNQALSDLRMLYTAYPEGSVIEAGVPWYATVFGRDALITAWQILMINPEVCRETLRFLALYQGDKVDPQREEEPGKIIHEIRRGEMANCKEILHTPYYGSVDATLWFIIVLGEFVEWTGDIEFLKKMRTPFLRALEWCTDYGDKDGDGYIEYSGQAEGGLVNQGWKDSWDGVPDTDGNPVERPLALVEVQAYLYAAYRRAAKMLYQLGEKEPAKHYQTKAQQLCTNFRRDFWVKEGGYLGLALDARKRLIPTMASNMGHALFTGILTPRAAKAVARKLLSPEMFSLWGIRTLSRKERAYNPISYHNGSVWPHDNSIIAAGLRKYNLLQELEKLVSVVFDAALRFPYYRLPEVFCGFGRRPLSAPVRYPIACEPQAWAAGSVFLLLQACLGIQTTPDGLAIKNPVLPAGLKELHLRGLRFHGGKVDIDFEKRKDRVICVPVEKEGEVRVVIEA